MRVTRSSVRRSKCVNYPVTDCVYEEHSSCAFDKDQLVAEVSGGVNPRKQRVGISDRMLVACNSSEGNNNSQRVVKGGNVDAGGSSNDVAMLDEGVFTEAVELFTQCVCRGEEKGCGYKDCKRKRVMIGKKRVREQVEEECENIRRWTLGRESAFRRARFADNSMSH